MAVPPRLTEVEVGLLEIEKSGTTTVKLTDVVWVKVPSVPLIVMLYVPPGVVLLVWTVRVEGL